MFVLNSDISFSVRQSQNRKLTLISLNISMYDDRYKINMDTTLQSVISKFQHLKVLLWSFCLFCLPADSLLLSAVTCVLIMKRNYGFQSGTGQRIG